jgi:hypothetical protein
MTRRYKMKFINIILMTMLLYAGSFSSAEEAKKEPDNNYFYILNYSFSNADAEIEINGVPVAKSKKEFNYSSSGFSDIGQWIFPGENSAEIKISPLMKKKENAAVFPKIEFSISLARAGQMSNEGKKILQFRIPETDEPGAAPVSTVKLPFKKRFSFIPEFPPPSELWSKAKQAPLNAANKKLIAKLVSDYHTALVKKDVDKLSKLLTFRVQDICRIRYYSPEEGVLRFKDDLKEMLATEGFTMEAMNAKKLVFHPLMNGRIIWVTNPSQGEPLQTKKMKDSGRISFAVYVSYIDGGWVVVR